MHSVDEDCDIVQNSLEYIRKCVRRLVDR